MRASLLVPRTVVLAALLLPARAGGQSSGARVFLEGGAMAVGALTHASPAIFGESRTEAYLTQPNLLGRAGAGPVTITGTLNLEGYTLRRGELNAGIYGEGYVDRRHPHTLVHELMLAVRSPSWHGVQSSLAAGKGFTPYGTDDPMMRPFVKYPVNHHHAQIIERVQVVGAVALGDPRNGRGVAIEHAFFNGDEPVSPFKAPQYRRLGDSRATRLTLAPSRGLELQVSRAFVRSPGITQGGAFDHTQTSASLRFDRSTGMQGKHDAMHGAIHGDMSAHSGGASMSRPSRRYLLLEVARTDEGFGSERAFRYHSVLAEGLVTLRGWETSLRAERTDRPENERLLDPFRIPNGHIDFQIIGITRWQVATAHVSAPPVRLAATRAPGFHLTPYVEITAARPTALRKPAVFEPDLFYGGSTLWSFTVGLRLHLGAMRTRMGRYGVLDGVLDGSHDAAPRSPE